MEKWDIVSSRRKGNPVAGVSLFVFLLLVTAVADHMFGLPSETVKAALIASALSSIAVAL